MATKTSHSLVFLMTADTKQLQAGMKLTKKELGQAKREMSALLTPAEKMEIKLKKLGELAKKDAKFQGLYNEALRRSQKQMKATASAAKGMGSSIKGMIGAYVGFHSVMRLGRVMGEELQKLDDLGKAARTAGLSVEFLSRMQFIAGRTAGMAVDATANAMAKMVIQLNQAALLNSGSAFDSLSKGAGLTRKEIQAIARMKPDQMFIAIKNAINSIDDENQGLLATQAIFGRGATALRAVIDLQNSAYQEQIDLVNRLGGVRTKQQTDEAERLNDDLAAAMVVIDALKARTAIGSARGLSNIGDMFKAFRSKQEAGDVGFAGINLSGRAQREAEFERKTGRGIARRSGSDLGRSAAETAAILKAYKAGTVDRIDKQRLAKMEAAGLSPGAFKGLGKGITSAIHSAMRGGQAGALEIGSLLNRTNIRLPVELPAEPVIGRVNTTSSSGPLSSAAAGSSEAFRLLNQTSSVTSVEVELAKKTAEKTAETVSILDQINEKLGMGSLQQKEHMDELDGGSKIQKLLQRFGN